MACGFADVQFGDDMGAEQKGLAAELDLRKVESGVGNNMSAGSGFALGVSFNVGKRAGGVQHSVAADAGSPAARVLRSIRAALEGNAIALGAEHEAALVRGAKELNGILKAAFNKDWHARETLGRTPVDFGGLKVLIELAIVIGLDAEFAGAGHLAFDLAALEQLASESFVACEGRQSAVEKLGRGGERAQARLEVLVRLRVRYESRCNKACGRERDSQDYG